MHTPEPRPLFKFEELRTGQVFATSQRYGEREMTEFEGMSGDHSAIHVDEEAAKEHGFDGRLLYGFLFLTLLSRIVGENLHRAVCAAVTADFVAAAFPGEEIEVEATVDQVQEQLRGAVLKFRFRRGEQTIARGKLTVRFLG